MKKIINKLNAALLRARIALDNKRAEGFVDSGIKILVAIVVGSLLLAGLYALFGDTIMPTLTQKIKDLFNYTGN